MKILIVSQYYYPEQFQINEIAPELVKRGHEVTVLCGLPNYPQGRIYDGYGSREKKVEILDGVKVVRCWQIARGQNVISLVLNYLSYYWSASRVVKRLEADYDIVLSYQLSPVISAHPAIVYKHKHKVPLLMYCLDIWPESVRSNIKNTDSIAYGIIHRWSQKIYNACDRILVTSKPFIDYLHRVNRVPVEKLAYLPQHAGAELLEMDLQSESNGTTNFMFAGNLGKAQMLDVIVNAAAELGPGPDYKIHFVGDGSCRQELQELVRTKGLTDNVIFHGYQPRSAMPAFYKKADVLIITLRGNTDVGNTMPGKLQMYMTTGKPVIGAINGAAREVIDEAGCGKCVEAGDYKGLASLMKYYVEHPEDYARCGQNAKQYFRDHFTLEKYVDRLEGEMMKMLKYRTEIEDAL